MEVLPNTVAIGYVHPHTVFEGFARSLAETCLIRDNNIIGLIGASSPRQEHARNTVIEKFLYGVEYSDKHVGAEWLMWIDTDMTFERDSISRLLHTAKTHKADMVGGLAFVFKRTSQELTTNAWTFDKDINEWVDIETYTPGQKYEIDGTGAAFLLIHRRVLEAGSDPWHNSGQHAKTGKYMGHDLAFCYDNVVDGDFKLVWDTSVKTGHIKHFELTEENYAASRNRR